MFAKRITNIFLIVAVLSGFTAWSQSSNSFSIEFTQQNAESNNTGIIDAYVKIRNISGKTIEGVFDAHASHEDLYLSQRKERPVTLVAGDSIFIPVKAIISTTAAAGNKSNIEAIFTIPATGESNSAILPVLIRERKLVKMLLLETNLIYENIGDSLSIPIRIFNEGNKAQNIAIVARYPDFITKDALENTIINVKAFTDTIITLRKQVNRTILKQEDFTVNITTLYHNGDIIGSGTVRASSIKQDRRYVANYETNYGQTLSQANQVTASYQRNSDQSSAYYLYANAEAQINSATVEANLDMNRWDNMNQVFVRNTWLAYRGKTFGAVAGNITRFDDINLIGRGGEAYFAPNEKNKFDVGAIDKTFDLLDDSDMSLGKSAWAGYTHNGGWTNRGYDASVIYDDDSYFGAKSYLASSKAAILNGESLSLRAGAAISNISNDAQGVSELGGAGELHAMGKIKKFFFSSSNYLSTGYFAGLKRGVTSLNQRLNLSLGKFNTWGVFNYLSVSPEVISSQFASSTFSSSRYDFGVARQFKVFSLSLSPYYFKESRIERLISTATPVEYSMDATRANLGINYTHGATNQHVSFNIEGGYFETNMFPDKQFHYKATLAYSWKVLNVLAFYQHNNFYLGEIIASSQLGKSDTFYNLNVSPYLQMKFLNNKLTVNAGMTYSQNLLVTSLQVNGRVEYDITKDFTVFAYNYYSDFSAGGSNVNTIQAGITKRFNPIKVDRTQNDLTVYIYYDVTGKGPDDASNAPAANQLVIIDGKAFRTNSHGMVQYRKLPSGTYEIRTINTNDWHAYTRTVTTAGDTRVDIALSRTATLKGSINYFATDKSYQITRKTSGLSVIAVDDAGNVFNTKTDENGNFIMYVPKGTYTVTLEKQGISEYVDVESNNQQVETQPNAVTDVKFKLNIKEKRVETRKFSSGGFQQAPSGDKKKK